VSDPLPQPAIAPDTYTERYFLEACAGHEPWAQSGGRDLDPRYAGTLELAHLAPGETLVDVGCGRGELLVAAVAAGAASAIGVEYAAAAIELAQRTIDAHAAGERARVLHADARALPLPDGEADLVTMLDIVEHLAPDELDRALREALRVLRPEGRLLVHTLPNRLIYDVTYRLQRRAWPPRWRAWPRDPRNDYERDMHVNEQRVGSLRRALRRAGFNAVHVGTGGWIHDEFVPDAAARRLYHRLAAHHLTARLGAADIWGHGRRAG
jgi:ubiquinone/menaquinone biosynthesis C-methylase UbiE